MVESEPSETARWHSDPPTETHEDDEGFLFTVIQRHSTAVHCAHRVLLAAGERERRGRREILSMVHCATIPTSCVTICLLFDLFAIPEI